MMGRTHAVSGAVAFLALAPLIRSAAGVDLGAVEILVGSLTAAGAAMLPDLDQPGSSVARAAGPITGLIATLANRLSGGHRQGTHSLLGLAGAVAIAAGVQTLRLVGTGIVGEVITGLYLALLTAIALAAVRLRLSRITALHTAACLALGVAVTALSVWQQMRSGFIPWAVGIGYLAHLAGDCLTREGCPLLWPLPPRTAVLKLTTDGPAERYVVGPVLGILILVLAWQNSDHTAVLKFVATIGARVDQAAS